VDRRCLDSAVILGAVENFFLSQEGLGWRYLRLQLTLR
jgi:hypothetical protein